MANTTFITPLRASLKSIPTVAFLAGFFSGFPVFAQQIELSGLYSGKNIYVQSPGEGEDYCVKSVVVNGIVLTDIPKHAAFEIPLDKQFLTIGDSVHIIIHHQEGCKPKILNSSGCLFSKQESVSNFSAAKGVLFWTYKNPPAGYRWIVQHYRWSHWDSIGVVTADRAKSDYTFQVPNLHSGDNCFRLVGVTDESKTGLSEELHVEGAHEQIEMVFNKKEHYIVFSSPTLFRLINEEGKLIREDSAQSFQVSDLKKGSYFLLFDNHSARIKL